MGRPSTAGTSGRQDVTSIKSHLFITVATATGLLLLASAPARAHHGAANLYDMTKPVMLKGTISKFYWGNPHNEVTIDVKDEKGNVAQWVAYTEPPLVMLERGWTRKSLNAGEEVTAYIFPARRSLKSSPELKPVRASALVFLPHEIPAFQRRLVVVLTLVRSFGELHFLSRDFLVGDET